jgi:aminopeptidase
LEFKKWVITKYSAKKNEKVLKGIISIPNANKLGEFSLTDSRFSHITKFMWETLYDENVGGKYGNTHVAVGGAFNDALKWNIKNMKPKDFEKLWFNQSAEHVDIVSTENRTVTAILKDGTKKVIYKDGKFTI